MSVESAKSFLSELDVSSLASRRQYLAQCRAQAAARQAAGEGGIEICNGYSDQLDQLLQQMLTALLEAHRIPDSAEFALICVGGNGRRRPAPYSDVDLLLVVSARSSSSLAPVFSAFVRDCWDTGLQLGHSIRPPEDVVRFAKEDVQFATSLVDMRLLQGNRQVFQRLSDQVQKKVFQDGSVQFVQDCVRSRREEWTARGDSVNQLEPDVKRSPGGLRDLHLIRWVTFAQFGNSQPWSLLEHNAVRTQELAALNQADEFLTSLRLELHCRAGLKQDVLTRDLQLEIVRSRGEVPQDHRRAVETFMQEYFRQTSRVAEIARRVTEAEQRPTLLSRLKSVILSPRTPRGFSIQDGVLLATDELIERFKKQPELVMEVFEAAAENQAAVSADLRKVIGKLAARLPAEPSPKSCSHFRHILRAGIGLPATLRAMYETKVLDWLVPAISEIRCLMQFNQYHSYTVDEHTLKTIDEVVSFSDDTGPVGTAYASVRHKATLHLSLILHDIGKGRDGDHSIVGEKIAEEVATRLQAAENKKRMMMTLVRQHLVMPDLAFRRDVTDQALLIDFARMVGAPEVLRMLYVLSVADIKAVGPDVWTDWKGDLLADLYNRTMLILSGRPINHLETERLQLIREHVRTSLTPSLPSAPDAAARLAAETEQVADLDSVSSTQEWPEWIERQLDALPPFYLMTEEPGRIAKDLDYIRQLSDSEVRIEGEYEHETDTVNYRIFASSHFEKGAFHKVAGVLSGMRMDIHTAQSCTTAGGTLIGSFLVSDNDFSGRVPENRIQDVCSGLANVLTGKVTVDHIFRRSGLFKSRKSKRLIQPVEPHISIDNDCSEKHTVIDVFAMDSPGLLYTLALTLHQHQLSVELTRIATNVDQVVDVFYVVDEAGEKLEDPDRLAKLKEHLMQELYQLRHDRDRT